MRSSHTGAEFPPFARPRAIRADHPARILFLSLISLAAAAGSAAPGSPAPPVFSVPESLTDTSRKYQLSRNAGSQLGVAADGTVHVTYGSGGFATSPGTPSYIYYRSRAVGGTWSAEEVLDDSEVGGSHVGGRHSSLAIRPDGGVWVVWHDHRHCTPGGNWIDNIEIYGDYKPPGGSFSSVDTRLTTSSALHNGDNGYVAKVAALPDGSVAAVWYDFHVGGSISDIYLKRSDTAGVFNTSESMASMRLTDLNARGGTPAYSLADLAGDSDGGIHLVWMTGFGAGAVHYGEVSSGGAFLGESALASASCSYFDPPHIAAATDGAVWLAWMDQGGSPRDIRLALRPAGGSAFGAPFLFHPQSATRHHPDLKVDAGGLVHLVWVDERMGEHVYYGVWDPESESLLHEVKVTETSANWARPSICLTSAGDVHILWEHDANFASGRIWYASAQGPAADPTSTPTLAATSTPSPAATASPTVIPTATAGPCCPGDADNSGSFVDANDFIAVQANFGADNGVGGAGDADCGGSFVDANDFIAVQANFGANCG